MILGRLLLLLLLLLLWLMVAATAHRDGLALAPPMGWRSWNLYGPNIDQKIMMQIMNGMTRRERLVDGKPTSLADLGYRSVGLDDNWQVSTAIPNNPRQCTYHDASGRPIVNTTRFPNLLAMTRHAHRLNLTAGWYLNNCLYCHEQCLGDPVEPKNPKYNWATSVKAAADRRCYEGDVAALVAYEFDSVKLDACGWQLDLDLWADLIAQTGRPIEIESCHWGKTIPVVDATATSDWWCPFHMYRVSGDIWASYGSIMGILRTVEGFTGLSRPSCWAYLDMLEVGCKGGPNREQDVGLNKAETKSHFGAWAIVSSPLILSHDVNDPAIMDDVWPVIANPEAIAVNQAWAGFAGGPYRKSNETITFTFPNSKFRPVVPRWQYLYKPVDSDRVAILVMNSANEDVSLTVDFSHVPGLACTASGSGCAVRDIWQRKDLGIFHESYTVKDLPSHDAAFLMLSTPPKPTVVQILIFLSVPVLVALLCRQLQQWRQHWRWKRMRSQ